MRAKKNLLEWTVFALSMAVIAAVVMILLRAAVRSSDDPPDLRITTGNPVASGAESWRVPVMVRNEGGQTAEEALVEVILQSSDREVERAEILFPFVPRKSARHGWVVFRTDPRCCKLVTRPVGFQKP